HRSWPAGRFPLTLSATRETKPLRGAKASARLREIARKTFWRNRQQHSYLQRSRRSEMIYFDAAYIAKFYLDEPDSGRVRQLAEESGEVACCLHGRVEVLIAFHRKFRERSLSPRVFAALRDQFEADCASEIWAWLPISGRLIATLSE